MSTRYAGVQTQRHLRPDGSVRIHRYYRPNRTPLHAEPGTAAFDEEYERARARPRTQKVRRKRAGAPRCYVYFVQCVTLRHIKIGRSERPLTRFKNLQTGCPDEVRLLGVIEDAAAVPLETHLQRRFLASRLRGEWYRETPELLEYIAEHARPCIATYTTPIRNDGYAVSA